MEYRTVYDAFATNYLFNGALLFLAIFPIWGGLSFFAWSRSRHKGLIIRTLHMGWITGAFVVVAALTLITPAYEQYILYRFDKGGGVVVEGVVHETEYKFCKYERFDLNGEKFSITPACGRSKPLFFNKPGVIVEGMRVRIASLGPYILKVEVKQ